MATEQNEYVRLPGRGSFIIVGTNSRLYLGKDHLLRVNSNGWTEKYRRFYFTDIQAIVVNCTNERAIWASIHGMFFTLFAVLTVAIHDNVARVVLGAIAFFFCQRLLVHLLRGPMCAAQIQTRLGAELLPSIKRMAGARKILDLLQPRIDAAQGTLNQTETPGQSSRPFQT